MHAQWRPGVIVYGLIHSLFTSEAGFSDHDYSRLMKLVDVPSLFYQSFHGPASL